MRMSFILRTFNLWKIGQGYFSVFFECWLLSSTNQYIFITTRIPECFERIKRYSNDSLSIWHLPFIFTLATDRFLLSARSMSFSYYYMCIACMCIDSVLQYVWKFYYPIKLHYSQTLIALLAHHNVFYYPIKLHYSQTRSSRNSKTRRFYSPIKLHYSQTWRLEASLLQCFTTL